MAAALQRAAAVMLWHVPQAQLSGNERSADTRQVSLKRYVL